MHRRTSLQRNILVNIVSGYVVLGFVVMQILFFGAWCRPFHNYWKVPSPNCECIPGVSRPLLTSLVNCSAETNHMITNAVLNISSDIIIIGLPMPVFIQSQLPIKRKVVLCGVFALGIFTVFLRMAPVACDIANGEQILAAALSKYYSLENPYGNEWIYWYIREVSTAIITANLPLTWTLLQHVFRLGSFHAKYGKSSGQRTGEAATGRFRSAYGNLTSCTRDENRARRTANDPNDISPSESQEQITSDHGIPMKIMQQHEVHITSEEVSSDGGAVTPVQSPGSGGVVTAGSRSPVGSVHGDKSEGDLGVVTKVYHGV